MAAHRDSTEAPRPRPRRARRGQRFRSDSGGVTTELSLDRPLNSPLSASSSQRAPHDVQAHESSDSDARYRRSTRRPRSRDTAGGADPRSTTSGDLTAVPPQRTRPGGQDTRVRLMSVTYEQRGPFAVIKINRPEARNAVNGAVASGIEDAIDKIEADDSDLGRDPHRRAAGVLRRRRSQGDQLGQRRRPRHQEGRLRRHRAARAHQADHRRGRRSRPRRRHRDRAVLRPRRRLDHRHVRHPRGQALPRGRCRWPVPTRPQDPDQHRHGAHPHRRPDRRHPGAPLRAREPARRARPGARRGHRAGRADLRQRTDRGARVAQDRPRGHLRPRRRRAGACRPRAWPRPCRREDVSEGLMAFIEKRPPVWKGK